MLSEGSELIAESGKVYTPVSNLGQANVWVAVEKGNNGNIVVLKEPDGAEPPPWETFQHEMIMHETFKQCPQIRKQVDRIPPTRQGGKPTLVLEMFETTVWTARSKRPFSVPEVKAVLKAALLGLKDVHAQGLVYADLKMENIMLNGFDVHKPGPAASLVTKLGDLGTVMAPDMGQVQPVVYRAPEVYFKGQITRKADIWSWGLIYCHLMEARTNFSDTGMYDDLVTGTVSITARANAVRYAIANDYEVHGEAYYRDVALPKQDHRGKGNQWEDLRQKGIEQSEVDFLRWVMRADPRKRPAAEDILKSGWLDKSETEIAKGFIVPLDSAGHATMEYDPRRPKPSAKTAQKASRLSAGMTAADDETSDEPPAGTWREAITKNVPGASALSTLFSSATGQAPTPGAYTPNAAGKEQNPFDKSPQHAPPASTGDTFDISAAIKKNHQSTEVPSDNSWREAIKKNHQSLDVPSTASRGISSGHYTPSTNTTTTSQNATGTSPSRNAAANEPTFADSQPSWRDAISRNLPRTSSYTSPTATPGAYTPTNGPYTPNTNATGAKEVNPFSQMVHTPGQSPDKKRQKWEPSSSGLAPDTDDRSDGRRTSRDLVNDLISGKTVISTNPLKYADAEGTVTEGGDSKGEEGAPQRPGLQSKNTGTYLSYRG
jgi:protein kinase